MAGYNERWKWNLQILIDNEAFTLFVYLFNVLMNDYFTKRMEYTLGEL